ncbi:MAG: hypothetical protein C4K48_03875 [Candidatus Thorarchaeota archaeon]|nr:MAG: hypothetical protein C4K48_03875 [Candidatus Thorarchaeota archaeon]
MTDRERMLQLLDEFQNTIVKIMDERDTLQNESEEVRAGRREAEEKAWAAESKLDQLNEEVSSLKTQVKEAEASKTGEVDKIRQERDEFKKELDEISQQLTRVSELYREASAEKKALAEKVDVSDLLAIYITLIETVFYGKPHARILYTLHDVKTAITRKNIASGSGIMPAVVRKAVYDLASANLVKVDEESDEVTLTKDILRRG